jgi:hypothetical protein
MSASSDLEGIVGKWKHGPYLDGRDRNMTWLKVLTPTTRSGPGAPSCSRSDSAAAAD